MRKKGGTWADDLKKIPKNLRQNEWQGGLGPPAKWRISRGGAAPTIQPTNQIQIHCYIFNPDPQMFFITKKTRSDPLSPDQFYHWHELNNCTTDFYILNNIQSSSNIQEGPWVIFTKTEVFHDTKEIQTPQWCEVLCFWGEVQICEAGSTAVRWWVGQNTFNGSIQIGLTRLLYTFEKYALENTPIEKYAFEKILWNN